MLAKRNTFIIGATGFIGGTVLQRLREHHTAPTSKITALVRNATKLPLFASIGIKTIFGTLDDVALLERQASKSDVVFACADSEHIPSCEAILRGLKKRHQQTGTVPVFIHTSGSDVVNDDAEGMYSSDLAWDDSDPDQVEKLLNDDYPRLTDLLVLEADKQGYARTYIVLPSTIYDLATGPLVDLGIQHAHSVEIPKFIQVSLKRRRAGMVGLGLNIWSNVHIDDIGDLYILLYEAILDGRAGHGVEGMYFGENGEDVTRSIAERIGEAFVEFGLNTPSQRTPTSFDEKDYAQPENKYLRSLYGANSRCKANRARALGWKPRHTTEDMLESIRDEMEWQLRHNASAWKGAC